jgi:hypothetical protein
MIYIYKYISIISAHCFRIPFMINTCCCLIVACVLYAMHIYTPMGKMRGQDRVDINFNPYWKRSIEGDNANEALGKPMYRGAHCLRIPFNIIVACVLYVMHIYTPMGKMRGHRQGGH